MSTKPDINLISFNGPGHNGGDVDWSTRTLIGGPDIDDTLKCSTGLTDFKLHVGEVETGREDALDINNHCRGIQVHADQWVFPKGVARTGFTIKGNSHGVRISGSVLGDPLVELGNWSDQSNEPVTNVRLALRRTDGKAIRVRVFNGDLPVLEPGTGPYRFVFPWKIKLLQRLTFGAYSLWKRVTG